MKNSIILLITLSFGIRSYAKDGISVITIKTEQEIKYITAKSGLICRDKPKGKRLGKFEFNEKIIITEHTNVFQEIKNGSETIKGEWLGAKLNNKTVYVFGGFLSDVKAEITPELVKEFMGNNVWISQGFKNALKETKLLSKAYEYGGVVTLLHNVDDLYSHRIYTANDQSFNINSIVDINNKVLKLKDEQKMFVFEKTSVRFDHNELFFKPNDECIDKSVRKWFSGTYLFKNAFKTKKYKSDLIRYYLFWQDDIVEVNNRKYQIDKVIGSTYYLTEIEFVDVEEEEGQQTIHRKYIKATLTKIK